MNKNLAEVCGVIAGDGHLSKKISKKRTNYKVFIFGHKTDDKEYFKFLSNLFQKVFKRAAILKEKDNCIELRLYSKEAISRLEEIGLPIGDKGKISIPVSIKNDIKFAKPFLRGLADTDFSVVFKKRKKQLQYPRITADLKSFNLVNDVCFILKRLEIGFCGPYTRNRIRDGSRYTTYLIDINGHENFKKWMKEIGFSNSKHLKKIKDKGATPY